MRNLSRPACPADRDRSLKKERPFVARNLQAASQATTETTWLDAVLPSKLLKGGDPSRFDCRLNELRECCALTGSQLSTSRIALPSVVPKLRARLESLGSSLWFLPSIFIIGAIIAALTLIEIDTRFEGNSLAEHWPRIFGAGAAGARGMLTAIASSMITVAGVAFSITIVALALASSQYTSRILRNFMDDRANQVVLGVLTSVFVYCLVVLRTIRGGDEGAFVPALAVSFAVILALVGIGSLIFFIHHIASSIQAERIIKAAADETIAAIDRLFPSKMGQAPDLDERAPELPAAGEWRTIASRRTGYIQGVDIDGLLGFARDQNAVVRMERGVGDFVVEDSPLVSVADGAIRDKREQAKLIDDLYEIGSQRTMVQDAAFGIRQIVDVALKALSPGVNDTTTAVTCVDYLGAILARLANRNFESPYRMDHGALRVIARRASFPTVVAEALDQIRQNADGNVAVLHAMLRTLEVIAERTSDLGRRRALRRQADLIVAAARRTIPTPEDRLAIEAAFGRLAPSIAERPDEPTSARESSKT